MSIGVDAVQERLRGGEWLSPTVVLGLLRVAEAIVVFVAAILGYLTRYPAL